MAPNNTALLKIETYKNFPSEESYFEEEKQTVEIELLPLFDSSDRRRREIYSGLSSIDDRLELISARVEELNSEIENLTNHADGIDYMIAVASGVLAGLIDSFFVGEFNLNNADEWGNKKVEEIIKKVTNNNDIEKAIRDLEKMGLASDSVTNSFGGGTKHHLNDFAHHPTLVGLIFSFVTQFTSKAYGTDNRTGMLKVVEITNKKYIGKELPEKITFGVVFWFLHMLSDIAGSSTSVSNTLTFINGEGYGSIANGTFTNKVGTGLPGPILSLAKELSALPIFKNKDGVNKFAEFISEIFNDGFDFRREIGIMHELGKQAIPVIINECIVRGFYFVRKLCEEIKNSQINNIEDLKKINWKKTIPFGNRTVERMMTIAASTFTAFDVIDAAIRSGGFNGACLLRINYVGVGRMVIAVGTDVAMGIKKTSKENERMLIRCEQLELLNAKIYYKQADMWIEAENTEKALQEAYVAMECAVTAFFECWQEIEQRSVAISSGFGEIASNDPVFAAQLLDIIDF